MSLKDNLKRHERKCVENSKDTIKKRQCGLCPAMFRDDILLNNHLKYHKAELKYECDLCGQKYKTKQHLSRHLMVHN